MKPHLILLSQLLPVIHKVSGGSYLSDTMVERAENASLQRHSCFTRSKHFFFMAILISPRPAAKGLPEAHCYSRHTCSKRLFWF